MPDGIGQRTCFQLPLGGEIVSASTEASPLEGTPPVCAYLRGRCGPAGIYDFLRDSLNDFTILMNDGAIETVLPVCYQENM